MLEWIECRSFGQPIYHLKNHEIINGWDFEIYKFDYRKSVGLIVLKEDIVVSDKEYASVSEAKTAAESFINEEKS